MRQFMKTPTWSNKLFEVNMRFFFLTQNPLAKSHMSTSATLNKGLNDLRMATKLSKLKLKLKRKKSVMY